MTREELNLLLKRNPQLSSSENPSRRPLLPAKLKQKLARALDRELPGTKESVERVSVRFVGYRLQPLDPDNFAGSLKNLIDGLRHAKLIPGDEPWRITLETEQVKVTRRREERTEIFITR
jgi:hypothetical protein